MAEIHGKISETDTKQCLKEECAWWSYEYESCAIPRLGTGIDDLFNQLSRLNDRLRLIKGTDDSGD